MTAKKLEPPLFIDLPFDEAMRRYVQTKPGEVQPPPRRPKKSVKDKEGALGDRCVKPDVGKLIADKPD